jgi:hypothetical protein
MTNREYLDTAQALEDGGFLLIRCANNSEKESFRRSLIRAKTLAERTDGLDFSSLSISTATVGDKLYVKIAKKGKREVLVVQANGSEKSLEEISQKENTYDTLKRLVEVGMKDGLTKAEMVELWGTDDEDVKMIGEILNSINNISVETKKEEENV